jgi:hypothetical protein
VPAEQTGNIRNDMYLTSEALKLIGKKQFARLQRR